MPTFLTPYFSLHILEIINFTQNYYICPKEYREKKIRVKKTLNFFACDIGGGV